MASADSIREWVHPFITDQGTLAEIIKGVQQGLEAVTKSIDVAEDGFRIESALGLSLDALGALFGHKRQDGLGDNDYRNQLLTLIEDSTTQTVDIVERTVEWISGYTPTVEEPDPGTIRVRLPLNKVQYAADVYAQLNRVKAAGVRVIVGHLEEFFESFSETLLVMDHLFSLVRGMFYDSFIEPWPLIGGSGQWDWGNWDASGAKWDSSDEPSDDLLVWWTREFADELTISYDEDVLFLIGILYPPTESETLDTPTDALFLDGVLYIPSEPETITSLLDDLWFDGILFLDESIDWADMTDIITAIRIAFEVESFTGLADALYFDGVLYQKDSLTNWPLIGGVGQWDWGTWDGSSSMWDSSSQPSDVLFWFGIQMFADSLTISYDEDELFLIGILYLPTGPETLDTPTDALFLDGVLYVPSGPETLSTPDDNILIAWSLELGEEYPRRVAIIGSAVIGTHVIGFGVDIVYDHEWDSGSWDYAWWDKSDSSDMVVVVREVF